MIRLFDTARGEVAPLEPREPGKVSMYVCGPTVYAPPHLGHGRFSLVFDVLRRYLLWSGFEVRYVSNVTDVDDKIIERAATEARSPAEVVEENERLWYEAMDAIGVMRPTEDPHATDYVEGMVQLVGDLVERGSAYETEDGVYFSAGSVADYGLLARQPLDTLRAGARVEVGEEKRSPFDFALWKKVRDAGPSWPSPWGPGRPGWHTECVVMSLDLLGEGFDIHGGGQDLAFPHHENERAQAAASDHRFARHWVHNGFVVVGEQKQKMSKSLGNFTNLMDVVAGSDPRAYRLLVLRSHYRSPLEVNPATTADASAALARLDAFARRFEHAPRPVDAHAEHAGGVDADEGVLQRFVAAMDDDLDTPAAVDLLFSTVRQANKLADDGDDAVAATLAAAALEICRAVGLDLSIDERVEVPTEVAALADAREQARADRDWARADALRDQLRDLGWTLEDSPEGSVLRRI